jgi:thiamine-monophosphate kinase
VTVLGPGREFDRIRRILEAGGGARARGSKGGGPPVGGGGGHAGSLAGSQTEGDPRVLLGPGDDAAILRPPEAGGIVLSTDMAVEGVHFRLDWITPFEAGRRSAAAALSDLAAMAATPLGLLVSVATPAPGALAEALMAGVVAAARAAGAPLLGGDLARTPGPAVLDVVVVGHVEDPLLRSGARPGDRLWVTGSLGGAAAAVRDWLAGDEPDPAARTAFVDPRPRLEPARWLRTEAGATAGLDLSDGLGGDAGHLAAASGVGVVLEAPEVLAAAFSPGSSAAPDPRGVEADRLLEDALHGGEDYELLVALPTPLSTERVEEFRQRFDLSLSPVGWVVAGEGVWLRGEVGAPPRRLTRGGWDHFAAGDPAPRDPESQPEPPGGDPA